MTNTYCALYRKYRPENLDDVVGQNIIVKTLKNAIKKNHISHAYLFTGPRGTGKTSVAKILAKTINCLEPLETNPCNNCVSCTQINRKQNIDIIEIDAASNNGVDEIREIRNKVSLVPSVSKFKVYIIDEVHMLTTGAFNALLKTLEEPPSHIIFILATTEPHKIPNTILSRCQRFDFKRINVDDILSRLKHICSNENINISDDALKQIAISSDGGMRDAIGTLDQVISYAGDEITIEDVHEINGTLSNVELSHFVDLIIDKNLESLMEAIDKHYNAGKNIIKICEEIVTFFKNILLFKNAGNYFKNHQYDYQCFTKYLELDSDLIIEYINMFNSEINEIKKSNLPKFLFELLIIKTVSLDTAEKKVVLSVPKQSSTKIVQTKENVDKFDNKVVEKNDDVEKNNIFNDEIKKIQNIRISNTLARFNKQMTIKLKQDLQGLNSLLLDPDFSQTVSIILDGEIKASSDKNIIFVFETENSTKLFNDNIIEIEQVLESFTEKKYKVIGVEQSDWMKIKDEFNNKSRNFEYVDEPQFDLWKKNEQLVSNNVIEGLFGDAIEYEN